MKGATPLNPTDRVTPFTYHGRACPVLDCDPDASAGSHDGHTTVRVTFAVREGVTVDAYARAPVDGPASSLYPYLWEVCAQPGDTVLASFDSEPTDEDVDTLVPLSEEVDG